MKKSEYALSVLLILVIFFSFQQVAYAADHYVRSGATGANSGADWNNAWRNMNEIDWSAVNRGETVYVADGTYSGCTFSKANAGSNKIIIKKATASDHGAGAGWSGVYGDGTAVFGSIGFSSDYWEFDGVVGGGPGSWKEGYGFEISGNRSAPCVAFNGGRSNIKISHVNIHQYPDGTPMNSMVTFEQNIKGTTGACSNLEFSYLWSHHTFGCPWQIRDWNTFLIEYCYIEKNRNTAAWHSAGIADNGSDNATIRYNIWLDISGSAILDGIVVGTMDMWYFYGNVVAHSDTYGANLAAIIGVWHDSSNQVTATNWYVYNNSFVNLKGHPFIYFASPSGSNLNIRNNLFFGNRQNELYEHYIYIAGAGVSYDYNHYSATAHPGSFTPGPHENSFRWGPNCQLSVDTTNYLTNWPNGDFSLNQDLAPADDTIGNQFRTDLNGDSRGGDESWDIGAYEYGSPSTGEPPEPFLYIMDGSS